MAVENSDEDISILSYSECDDIDGTLDFGRPLPKITSLNCNPTSRISVSELALRTAYQDLKHRFNNILSEKQQLSQEVKRMEGMRYRLNGMEMDEERSPGAQGADAQGDAVSSVDVKALQGHIKSLERQLMVAKSQNQAVQHKCQEMTREKATLTQQLHQEQDMVRHLQQVVSQLKTQARAGSQDDPQQLSDPTSHHKQLLQRLTDLSRTNQELTDRVRELETQAQEAGVGYLRGMTAQVSRPAEKQVEELQERCRRLEAENSQLRAVDSTLVQGVVEIPSYSSLPATEELAELKRVIASLKKIVLQQRDFLNSLGVSGKLQPALRVSSCRMEAQTINGRRTSSLSADGVDSPKSPIMVDSPGMAVGRDVRLHQQAAFPPSTQRLSQPPNIPALLLGEDSSEDQPPPCGGLPCSNGIPSSPCRTDAAQRQRGSGGARLLHSEVTTRVSPTLQPHQRNLPEDSGLVDMERGGRSQYVNVDTVGRNSWSQREQVRQGAGDGHLLRRESGLQDQVWNYREGDVTPYQRPASSSSNGGSGSCSPSSGPREGMVGTTGPSSGGQGGNDDLQRNGSPSRTLSGRQCPVCSTDFSHLPMEDFQTHVFECFDDNQSPTETLHVAEEVSSDRVCPMCNNLFPSSTVSQEEFERHVQAHFGEDQFEILRP